MAEPYDAGVHRAAAMISEMAGATQSMLGRMATQLAETIERNQQAYEGLAAQTERLNNLLDYQRAQLAALEHAAADVPHGDGSQPAATPPADVDMEIDVGDTSISYGDRVLRLLAEQRRATVDDLVDQLVAAGDEQASRRKVSTSVTNLSRAGRVVREDDLVRLLR